MTVNFEKNGTTLTVKPEGRLDTITSPVLYDQLNEILDDVMELTFDLADLEYISSAGLRVLLAIQQKMDERHASMKAIHVGESVMQVFNLAGFGSVLEIE